MVFVPEWFRDPMLQGSVARMLRDWLCQAADVTFWGALQVSGMLEYFGRAFKRS